MGKGRSHRNRNSYRRSRQRGGGVTCLSPPRPHPGEHSQSATAPAVPLTPGEDPFVTSGMSRQARRKAEREQHKLPGGSNNGAITLETATANTPDAQLAPLPRSQSLSVPRSQWIDTLRDWVGALTYRFKRSLPDRRDTVDRSKLERLRRDLAQTQATLDGVIAGMRR